MNMKVETTEVSLRYVIFDPEQHIPGLCSQHLPGETWQSVPHNEIQPDRPELAHCTTPSYRHGVIMRHEATGKAKTTKGPHGPFFVAKKFVSTCVLPETPLKTLPPSGKPRCAR